MILCCVHGYRDAIMITISDLYVSSKDAHFDLIIWMFAYQCRNLDMNLKLSDYLVNFGGEDACPLLPIIKKVPGLAGMCVFEPGI